MVDSCNVHMEFHIHTQSKGMSYEECVLCFSCSAMASCVPSFFLLNQTHYYNKHSPSLYHHFLLFFKKNKDLSGFLRIKNHIQSLYPINNDLILCLVGCCLVFRCSFQHLFSSFNLFKLAFFLALICFWKACTYIPLKPWT